MHIDSITDGPYIDVWMDEAELFRQAGLPSDWLHEYVTESNKIDPQPGPNHPGTLVYDGHRAAVLYAIRMASEDRYALPKVVHELLLGEDNPLAGHLREHDIKIGLNEALPAVLVPQFIWAWNRTTHIVIDELRTDDDSIDESDKISRVWDLHCEFENIHPYELYNGKAGRILMVNHALLVDVDPWIIPCELGREDYFDMIRSHPSADWGINPPERYGEEPE
jgi:hypothetical protein